ncbi:hypothetical protein OQA88_6045 [Cercophora sp. LCS_1]
MSTTQGTNKALYEAITRCLSSVLNLDDQDPMDQVHRAAVWGVKSGLSPESLREAARLALNGQPFTEQLDEAKPSSSVPVPAAAFAPVAVPEPAKSEPTDDKDMLADSKVKIEDADVKMEDLTTEDMMTSCSYGDDTKEEDKVEDTQAENIKTEYVKTEDIDTKDIKTEDVRAEDVKMEHN